MRIECAVCKKAATAVKVEEYKSRGDETKAERITRGFLVCTHCGAYGHIELMTVMKPPKTDKKTDQEPE